MSTPTATGLLFIVCGPSGVGKSTLGKLLRERRAQLKLSVSTTTRAPRAGEQDGVDYHFVDRDTFIARRDAGEFVEWAEVHGNLYGTTRATIHAAWEAGHDVFFDIDYQGAQQLQAAFPEHTTSVLVIPPSMDALERRIRDRGTEDEATIARRLAAARHELEQFELFDYIIANKLLNTTTNELATIYDASRRRTSLRRGMLLELLG